MLLAVFISVFMSACSKDEPTASIELSTELGNTVSQFPYGYTEATITFACSEDFLEIFQPSFALLYNNNVELIKPKKEDFKLAEEKSTVSLVEKGDTVKREMSIYKYSFNVTLEESEGALAAFALNPLYDDSLEDLKDLDFLEEKLTIYRGYHDIDIRVYCPDSQFATANGDRFSNIFGYISEGNKVENLIDVYQLINQVPTLALEYKIPANGIGLPDFNAGATNLPYSEVVDFFNGLIPTAHLNDSYSYTMNTGSQIELISRVSELLRNRGEISLDVQSVLENKSIETFPLSTI